MMTLFFRHSAKPPLIAIVLVSVGVLNLITPLPRADISGACLSNNWKLPSTPGSITLLDSPL